MLFSSAVSSYGSINRYVSLPRCKFETLKSNSVGDSRSAAPGSSLNSRQQIIGRPIHGRRRTARGSSAKRAMEISTPKEIEEAQFAESEVLVSSDVAEELIPEALVWASLHGLVVGDRSVENSGKIAGVEGR
ncbi:hypothetical protein R1flu_017433 [Riccia fluitans]|uniref:Uncharacterized protein n=1 Tax=Riccia fluitans TaxID=41844 RepID=A0ABD1ZCY7_9MARC